jgi:hypothetical protein
MMPPPTAFAAAGPINPIEAIINGLNTNPYLIGMSMILLNLGGRHLSMGLTQQQDKFFQSVWMRRMMLFVVIFVATRNVFTALWLSIALILVIGYLFNEHSSLYLFGPPTPAPMAPAMAAAPIEGLTNEEQEIYKRLDDKMKKTKEAAAIKKEAEGQTGAGALIQPIRVWYLKNMAALRQYVA